MTRFGYTLMTEQSGPKELVRYAVAAEEVGFDFEVSSDHYSPWLTSQGHAPYAWTVLGAVAQATERVELMTYVTCPTMRYHPAVVAQKAATLQLLSDGRFILGLGSGENLNEHVTGEGWPPDRPASGHARGGRRRSSASCTPASSTTWEGDYFRVDSARIWDVPDGGVPIGIAVSGREVDRALRAAGRPPHHHRARRPSCCRPGTQARAADASSRKIGQIPICWGPDREAAIDRAHDQFRWFAGGWAVNADLPTPAGFAGASQFVRPEDVAEQIPCGPDLDAHRRGGQAVLGGRIHRHRARAGRRRAPAASSSTRPPDPLLEKLRAAAS